MLPCKCGHSKTIHVFTNCVTTQDACQLCLYSCMHFKEMPNLEYLEMKSEDNI